jgi:RNA polymerase sigma-70 factor (ECF subfamily)
MLRVALNFVRSPEEAEEVIQETWIAALAGIDKFEGRASFKTWLFRILINRARTRAKREARSIPLSALAPADAVSAIVPHDLSHSARQPDPEQELMNDELRLFIERAVASLPRPQRVVISLRDIEGWSAQETCAALRISAGHQRVLLHRARMRVRELLMPYLAAPADAGAVRL